MTNAPHESDWVRLGDLIKTRMAVRDLTADDIEAAKGPKPTKLREILNGRARTIRSSLKQNLERAIDWEPGSIDRVLAGDEPIARMTRADMQRPPGPLTAKEAADEQFIEDALAQAENAHAQRRLREKGGTSQLRRWMEIQKIPEEDRTPEQRDYLQSRITERNRLAHLARQSAAEKPLIDLVIDGQNLASAQNNEMVSAYVRQVESAVVGLLGFERVTDALDGHQMEQTLIRAHESGLLEPFMREIDQLRAAGVVDRELLHRGTEALQRLIDEQEESERGDSDGVEDETQPDASAEDHEDEEAWLLDQAARNVADHEKPE
ncbi:MAG: hypothetical protein K2Y33_04715 [Mycolicibacterium frederiksbergense]|nr:hypothetical protein [Mycolicibacterium frederiksbergense]